MKNRFIFLLILVYKAIFVQHIQTSMAVPVLCPFFSFRVLQSLSPSPITKRMKQSLLCPLFISFLNRSCHAAPAHLEEDNHDRAKIESVESRKEVTPACRSDSKGDCPARIELAIWAG
jgi:hypothetical protein